MPLPSILASMIRQAGDEWNPAAQHRDYVANVEMWRLYLDLLELDSTKLPVYIDAHPDESDAKLSMRRKMAAIFNFVPSIVRMTVNYLHSEQPTIEVGDNDLKAFVDNCNGAGMSFVEYVRREVLPLALTLGFIDILVQNPATPQGAFTTAADQQQAGQALSPRLFTVTPLQRTNWGVRQTHEYEWLRFKDRENDNPNPFVNDSAPTRDSYITVSAFAETEPPVVDEAGNEVGFWVKSFRDLGKNSKNTDWQHDGDWLPMRRCPVSTLYYQQSIDPDRRHFGISKVAMIAILTRKIAQLLSWSDEDILANLAIFVFPGEEKKDAQGKPIPVKLSPFSVIWLGNDAKVDPRILQGNTGHISIKWEIIDSLVREILRLAFLIGASAETEQITSGVQGVVARTELFQELSDLAGALDRFGLETLALAASLIRNVDVTVEQLTAAFKVTVNYNKGNYTVDPLATIIENANALITLFNDISPAMVKAVYEQTAQAALYNEDADRDTIMAEIRANFARVQAERKAVQDAITAAASAAVANPANNPTPSEGFPPTDGNPVNTPSAPAGFGNA